MKNRIHAGFRLRRRSRFLRMFEHVDGEGETVLLAERRKPEDKPKLVRNRL